MNGGGGGGLILSLQEGSTGETCILIYTGLPETELQKSESSPHFLELR